MSDGSTLPTFIQHWNTGVVYEAGVIHDNSEKWRIVSYMEYVKDISPLLLTERFYRFPLLTIGLAVYELSPRFIKTQFLKIT